MNTVVAEYNKTLEPNDRETRDLLATEIDKLLPETEHKILHAQPARFPAGSPVVRFTKLNDSGRLFFWSRQPVRLHFGSPGDKNTFKAPLNPTIREPQTRNRLRIATGLMVLLCWAILSPGAHGQDKPTTGYASVNGLKLYYEIHGRGEPVVLLHGAFMSITNNWTGWIEDLSKTRRVIVVEMQGHGRTADIERDITEENLADDVAALLDFIKVPRADVIGYSMGGAVAMQFAIRHPEKVRKAVIISSVIRSDGMLKEAADSIPKLTADDFKGSPIETEYKKLSPTPDQFPNFVRRMLVSSSKEGGISAEALRATTAPMFFIHGDADGVRLEHVAEMFRAKGGEVHGDMQPRSSSRLAILPNTTHVTLMERRSTIVPMVSDFLDSKE